MLYDFPDAVGIVQRALKNSIQTYEPRLKNVQVRHIKSEFASVTRTAKKNFARSSTDLQLGVAAPRSCALHSVGGSEAEGE